MNKKLTDEEYGNLDIAFALVTRENFRNENAVAAGINLRRKIVENLKDYDAYLTELEKPKIKPEE